MNVLTASRPVIIDEPGWGKTVLTTKYDAQQAIDAAIRDLLVLKDRFYEPNPHAASSGPKAMEDYAEYAERAAVIGLDASAKLAEIAGGYRDIDVSASIRETVDCIKDELSEIRVAADDYRDEMEAN